MLNPIMSFDSSFLWQCGLKATFENGGPSL